MEDVFEFTVNVTYNLTYPEGKTKDNVVKVIWKPVEGGNGYGNYLIVFDDGTETKTTVKSDKDINNVIVIWEK